MLAAKCKDMTRPLTYTYTYCNTRLCIWSIAVARSAGSQGSTVH